MWTRAVAVLTLYSGCGINPAFTEASSTTAATTGAEPVTTTTTTTGTTTVGLAATGDASTTPSLTDTLDLSTTGDPTSTTTATTILPDDTTTGPPASGACPDDDALIACYRFEEDPPDGVLVDGSKNAHHGSRAGTNAVASVDGFGAAVDLLGGSDVHVVYDPAFAPPELTVAAFVFIKNGQENKALLDRKGSYGLYLTNGIVECRLHGNDFDGTVGFDIDDERWYHFACTYDGKKLRLHGHGLEFNPTPAAAGLDGMVADTPGAEFLIGRMAGDDNTKYMGWVDQVLVFGRALGDDEVCGLAGPLCKP